MVDLILPVADQRGQVSAVREFTIGAVQSDDLTALVLRDAGL